MDDHVDELIAAVATKKPTVVLMEVPGAVLTPWRQQVAAIACLFPGGERSGAAWAAVLFGDVSPSGKLPLVMPGSSHGLLHPTTGEVVYKEGLRTSYRAPDLQAAFTFGHGLSYTTFEFGPPRSSILACDAAACVTMNVTNRGGMHGAEVVQGYVDFLGGSTEDFKVLRCFQKTSVLAPGQTEEVMLKLYPRDLSKYDVDLHDWRQIEDFSLHLGASSGDFRFVMNMHVPSSAAFVSARPCWVMMLIALSFFRLCPCSFLTTP